MVVDAAWLLSVLDNLSFRVSVLDSCGRLLWFNRAYAASVKTADRRSPAAGMSILEDCSHSEDGKLRVQRTLDRVLLGEEVVLEETLTAESDARRHWENRYVPARQPDGTIFGVVVLGIDVTSRVLADENRIQLERELQKTSEQEALAMLSGGIAHELGNLLVPIKLCTEMARDSESPVIQQTQLMDRILEAVRQVSDLTRQLLAFSGGAIHEKRTVDLTSLIREASKLTAMIAGRYQTIRFEQSNETLAILADADQVRQVLLNLVRNAVDAMNKRAGVITVRTKQCTAVTDVAGDLVFPRVPADGTFALLEVDDCGAGIPQADLLKLFEPLSSKGGLGRGLGLAAVAGIVRHHNGFISVRTVPGLGTRFSVGFPLVTSPADDSYLHDAMNVDNSTESERPDALKVLLADDDAEVRRVVEMALLKAGHQVTAVTNGLEALNRVRTESFDLLLIDLTMPEMSGMELLTELGQQNQIPVILMSGYSEAGNPAGTIGFGVRQILRKPFSLRDLLTAVKHAVE